MRRFATLFCGFLLPAFLPGSQQGASHALQMTEAETVKKSEIDEQKLQEFWALIERSDPALSQWEQLEALRRELRQLPADKIAEFDAVLVALHTQAYSWDLWGAAYVIKGGASDDGFHYFKSWVIGRGRNFYESALADPDSLAELIPDGVADHAEFEELNYVAREVWIDKTDDPEMPSIELLAWQSEPVGEPFDSDAESLKVRYPQLWERFGLTPL